MNKLYQKIGDPVCKTFPAYNAFKGCDYTVSFYRKGKLRPLKYLTKDEIMQEVFGSMGFD